MDRELYSNAAILHRGLPGWRAHSKAFTRLGPTGADLRIGRHRGNRHAVRRASSSEGIVAPRGSRALDLLTAAVLPAHPVLRAGQPADRLASAGVGTRQPYP